LKQFLEFFCRNNLTGMRENVQRRIFVKLNFFLSFFLFLNIFKEANYEAL